MTGRTTLLGSAAVAVLAAPLLLVGLLLTITTTTMNPGGAPAAINVDALPPLARELLPDLQELLARDCPQLPLAWALAIPQVESSWNPAAYNATGHAAGLYQLTQPAWTAAGGTPWPSHPATTRRAGLPTRTPPPARHPVPVRQPPHRHHPPRGDRETRQPARRAAGLPRRRLRPGPRLPHRHPRPRRRRLR